MIKQTFVAALAGAVLLAFAPSPAPAQAPQPAQTQDAKKPAKKSTKKRTPSPGQQAARARQKQCGAEWKAARAAGKVDKKMKWPQFWSECNKRLKAKGA
jgi:hypothetical protein